jgi:hypothetical protein
LLRRSASPSVPALFYRAALLKAQRHAGSKRRMPKHYADRMKAGFCAPHVLQCIAGKLLDSDAERLR